MRDSLIERYLKVLGVEARGPSLEALSALVRRHLERVPFENISKLLFFAREGRGRPIALAEFLDGIEHHDLGGTCYSSNPFLCDLLRALGYDAVLLGADMSRPDVHTSIRVRLGAREYHVDVGYAAPFREPIPLDPLPYEVSLGRDRYVFDRIPGGHQMTHFMAGEPRHGYVVHPPPRSWSFFHPTVVRSFEPGRTFMRCLRITRFVPNGVVELRNRRFVRVTGDRLTERDVESPEDLAALVREAFVMPRCPVVEAVAVLERLNGRPFFGGERWPDTTEAPE